MVDPDVGDSSGEEDSGGKPALPFSSLSTMAKLTQARCSPSGFASSSLSRSRSCSSSMVTVSEILRWNLTESFDLSGDSHVGSGEPHVLAVDDSHVDRKSETNEEIFGVLSFVFWTLTLVPLFKYVFIVFKADVNGEEGTFTLYSLLCRHAVASHKRANKKSSDPLDTFYKDNPETDECRTYNN
ncbi:hypothetical protein ACFX13_041481 [Malus domestica]